MGAFDDLQALDVASSAPEGLAELGLCHVARKVSAENRTSITVVSLHKRPAGSPFGRCLPLSAGICALGLTVVSSGLAKTGLSRGALLAPVEGKLVKRLCNKPRADGL